MEPKDIEDTLQEDEEENEENEDGDENKWKRTSILA